MGHPILCSGNFCFVSHNAHLLYESNNVGREVHSHSVGCKEFGQKIDAHIEMKWEYYWVGLCAQALTHFLALCDSGLKVGSKEQMLNKVPSLSYDNEGKNRP